MKVLKKPRKNQAVIVSGHNCPFYGRSGAGFPILLDSKGNQCALRFGSHSPCEMEITGRVPDWRACEIFGEACEPRRTIDNITST